jgi:hypothetical protein
MRPQWLTSGWTFVIFGLLVPSISLATYYVSPDGDDANPGTETAPFRTIQKGADVAQRGDTVLVKSGVYAEAVALKHSGVTFQALTPETPPKIDGGKRSRRYGFYTPKGTAVSDVTIDGFEIFDQEAYGILIDEPSAKYQSISVRLLNNTIHHVRHRGIQMSGRRYIARDNLIYMIGNSGESSGIQFNRVKDGEIRNNQIYLVRKQCIRVRLCNNVLIQDNVLASAGYNGLAWNSVLGNIRAYNNYIYNICVSAFEAKHSNEDGNTERNRFWHNTVHNSYGYAVSIWANDPPADYYDLQNNIFSAASHGFIRNVPPGLAEPHLYIDGNLYHQRDGRPHYVYGDQWLGGPAKTLAQMQSKTSFGKNGKAFDPQLSDPSHGQLDYPDTSPAAQGSLDLPSPFGRQLGARGLTPEIPTFQPHRDRAKRR